jgi:hypothetical protein
MYCIKIKITFCSDCPGKKKKKKEKKKKIGGYKTRRDFVAPGKKAFCIFVKPGTIREQATDMYIPSE